MESTMVSKWNLSKNWIHVFVFLWKTIFLKLDIFSSTFLYKIPCFHPASNGNHKIQIIFILVVIKADKTWIMDCINRLDNFDGPIVGGIDVGVKLYEETLAMVKKFDLDVQVVNVLLDNIHIIDRDVEFVA